MKKNKKNSFVKEVIDILTTFLVSFVIVFLTVHFIAQPIRVEGSSMLPTLESGSLGISNVLGLKLMGIQRFDIVVVKIHDEKTGKNKHIVKRVIGMPNDTISYMNNQLYINGMVVEETYLNQSFSKGNYTEDIAPITLQHDEYFCLGDNRLNSRDSRYYGAFKKAKIVCKGVFIFWPLKDFGVKTW